MSRIAYLTLAGLALASLSVGAPAKKSGAETYLLGVHLYDPGTRVIALYGSPDDIQAVNVGGGAAEGGGAANVGGGGPPGPGGSGNPSAAGAQLGPGARRGAGAAAPGSFDDFGFGNEVLKQAGSTVKPHAKTGAAAGGGANSGPGAAPAAAGGGDTGAASGGEATKTVFTRWVYHRSGCRYGFVMDKFNRVVQIEAIGLANPRVHTLRGIRFGSTFGQIIKKYSKNPDGSANAPDGYEISGNSLVVRYLVRNKVAFRLDRLAKDRPPVVTGIAIAAGRS